jgi:hypothetical protein
MEYLANGKYVTSNTIEHMTPPIKNSKDNKKLVKLPPKIAIINNKKKPIDCCSGEFKNPIHFGNNNPTYITSNGIETGYINTRGHVSADGDLRTRSKIRVKDQVLTAEDIKKLKDLIKLLK